MADSSIHFNLDKDGILNIKFELGDNISGVASLLHSIATGALIDRIVADFSAYGTTSGKLREVTTVLEIWRELVMNDTPIIKPSKVLDKFIK